MDISPYYTEPLLPRRPGTRLPVPARCDLSGEPAAPVNLARGERVARRREGLDTRAPAARLSPVRPSFNTAGPCIPGEHYMLPPERRLTRVLTLIEDRKYFTLHAGRQTGKTTSLMWLERQL